MSYPHLVVRYVPAVYGTVAILLVSGEAAGSIPATGELLPVPDPDPDADSGDLTTDRREAILEAAERYLTSTERRGCVVFAPDDCTYLAPDGTRTPSHKPPGGGLRLTGGEE